MVDENELAGKLSPQQVFEHINVGCDLIEKAPKTLGRDGTWEEFHQAIGLRSVSVETEPRGKNHSRQYPLRGGAGITKQKIVVSYNILAQLSPLRDTRQFWTTGL